MFVFPPTVVNQDLLNGRSYTGNAGSSHLSVPCKKKTTFRNCIGEVVRIWCPRDKRYFGGVILDFNCNSRKHTIIKEDGHVEILDLSKDDWDLI